MYVLVGGINHTTAPVDIREKFAICGVNLDNAYDYFKNHDVIEGAVVLNTCNRTEVYATARDIEKGMKVIEGFLEEYSGICCEELKNYLYQPNCYDAILHIFKVASGLDSMIVGEDQILGQVKEAHQMAIEAGASDGVLNALFQKAINVGKKVRTNTTISKQPLSISYAAVELAKKILGNLTNKTVIVIGAGEMSELTTEYLMINGVQSVIVSNRSYDRAVKMADKFDGRAVRFNELSTQLSAVDIVISCTAASHYVLHQANCRDVLEKRNGQKILMIDIAVPRDIDPALKDIAGVFIYDIDKLQNVVDANYLEKQKAIVRAEKIIMEELVKFNEWLAGLYVVPVITALKTKGEEIKQEELKRALNRLGRLSERNQKILNTLVNSIVNQLLHEPIVKLKEEAASNQGHLYAEVVKKLFSLPINEGEQKYENSANRNKG